MRFGFTFKLPGVLFAIFLLEIASLAVYAQEVSQLPESTITFPGNVNPIEKAIEDFHQVMAPLWQTSYPQKDFAAIREKAWELKEKIMALVMIRPTADLEQDRERLNDFLRERQNLAIFVSQVEKAAKDGPDSTLASAFESVHWTYQELEKLFSKRIKELESFHETLYFLWHRALPEKNYDTIKQTTPVLVTEADTLMKITLPRNFKVDKEDFDKRRTALKDAVYQFADFCQTGSEEQIDSALKVVYDKYTELDELLK
jgi:hypothetical protein